MTVSDIPNECALRGGQGCGPEEAAGREAGEEAEAGEGGPVDSKPAWAGLDQEGEVSQAVIGCDKL